MWISQRLNNEEIAKGIQIAKVVSVGTQPKIMGEKEVENPVLVLPYGIYGFVPMGEKVAVFDNKLLGVVNRPNIALEEGEVCLYSKGGSLVLKNNGDLLLNGQKIGV